MKQKVVIIGAGGHARSILDILLQDVAFEVVGCLDRAFPEKDSVPYFSEVKIIGTDSDLTMLLAQGIRHFFVALGDNKIRNRLYTQAIGLGFIPINVISPFAHISSRAHLGKGICVMAGASINVNSVIGDNTIVNTNASIDHDCVIGHSVHIAPGCALSGGIHIGDRTHIGTGSSIIENISIGAGSIIGAGSVVVKNLDADIVAYGVPARPVRSQIDC